MDALPSESIAAIQNRIDKVLAEDTNSWLILGETYLAHNWYDIAAFCFHEGSRLNPINARAFFLEALSLDLQGKFKESIEKYKIARTLEDSYAAILWRMALAELELGNTEEAILNAELAVQTNQQDPYALKALSYILLECAEPEKSAAVLSKYLQVVRNDRYAHLLMGKSLQQLGNPNAKSHLAMGAGASQVWADPWSSAVMKAGVGPQFERKRALALIEANKSNEAIPHFESLVSRYPDEPSYKLNLSTALRASGLLDRSIALASQVAMNNPEDHLAMRQTAAGLFDRYKLNQNEDDLTKAISLLNDAIALTKTSEVNYILIGQLYAVAGNKMLAAKNFEVAGSIAHWMPQLTLQAAKLYSDLGKFDDAIALLKELRETYTNDVQSMVLEAKIYIELRDKKKALETISKAVKIAPQNPELLNLTQQASALSD